MKSPQAISGLADGAARRGAPAVASLQTRSPLKVAVCATHPIQYQAPLWRRLAQRPDWRVKVIFGTDMSVRGYRDEGFGVALKWDTPMLEGYDYEFVSTDPRIQRVHFRQPGFRGVRARLRAFAPDVVLLTAYRGLFHLGALMEANRLGARVVMRHEASDVAEARSSIKGWVRDAALRRLYARIDRFAAIGVEARRHLLRVGVPASRIGSSPYCVDSDFVQAQIELWRPRRDSLRAQLGLRSDDLALVFAGKLTPKKDPLLIITALATLPPESLARIHLVVAGDGELRLALEQAGRALLGNRLHLLGFLNQSEIGRAYASGDCLILPSRKGVGETWGLVVNEAMQFGLPAIVSDGVGCCPDLVREGRTGWIFPSGDARGLAQMIRRVFVLGPGNREAFSAAVRKQVAGYSLWSAVRGLGEAISLVSQT